MFPKKALDSCEPLPEGITSLKPVDMGLNFTHAKPRVLMHKFHRNTMQLTRFWHVRARRFLGRPSEPCQD